MNPPTTLTNHNPPATIGCGLNPNPIRREESDTPHTADASKRNNDGIETGICGWSRDKGPPRWALSRGAACMWPRRCPVYRWRELIAGAGMEQENLSPR